MSDKPVDAREALDNLIDAFERHFEAVGECESILDDDIVNAEDELQDAFFIYDSMLYDETGVELPFDILDDDDDIIGGNADIILDDDDYDEDEDDLDDAEYYEDDDFDETDEDLVEIEDDSQRL